MVALLITPGVAGEPSPTSPPVQDHIDVVDACLADHERAQIGRSAGDLLKARHALQACAIDACPQLVRRDCMRWLAEVEAMVPTVRIDVVVDGTPIRPDGVWIDDNAIEVDDLEQPLELNPGIHRFRAQLSVDGQSVQVEEELVVYPSVGRQPVRLEFRRPVEVSPAPSSPAPSSLPPDGARQVGPEPHTLKTAGYASLGAGLALTAVALGTGISGLQRFTRAEDDCAPFCDQQRVRSIRLRLLTADISAALGGVALVSGLILALVGRTRARATQAPKKVSVKGDIHGVTIRF